MRTARTKHKGKKLNIFWANNDWLRILILAFFTKPFIMQAF